MKSLSEKLSSLDLKSLDRHHLATKIASVLRDAGYEIVEIDEFRPWGQFFRIKNEQAPKFIEDFFGDIEIAHRGLDRTPKILLQYPMQRNSWQYHNRRKEYWKFLTDGFYYRNADDQHPSGALEAKAGEVIILNPNERHRLSGHYAEPTLVAEIWEHTADEPSDEEDIVRLHDDYKLLGRKVGK
ncbi:MAG: phosphoheptose isomerase [Candidatus Nomurabacteria bacterium]|jgi:mannose-6-phosphate isomerase-like protein (cupin superfamily)|nr:phosphoheptose isomerase [Candidatus Nomurabacteria bacterium]